MSHESTQSSAERAAMSRRGMLGASAAGALAAAAALDPRAALADRHEPGKLKGNIKHSIVYWCFAFNGAKWSLDEMCGVAKSLGCKSVELLDVEQFATVSKHGLKCAIANNGMPGAPFVKGLNNPAYQAQVIESTSKVIEAAGKAGVPSVIAFTGYKYKDVEDYNKGVIDPDAGATNTVNGLKKLAKLAERQGVTICVEHLNSRVDDHAMKGHPGYAGDDVDYCFDIIRRVGSPNVKLLFDIYHVQVMNGDLVRRIKANAELIGHIHTAGNPGRLELHDKQQEINYTACMNALVEIGYKGYVGHEFIPTIDDPKLALAEAVRICDV